MQSTAISKQSSMHHWQVCAVWSQMGLPWKDSSQLRSRYRSGMHKSLRGKNQITARTINMKWLCLETTGSSTNPDLQMMSIIVVSDSLRVQAECYMPIINKPSACKRTNPAFIVSVLALPLTGEDGCLQVSNWQRTVIGRIKEVTTGKGCGSDDLSCNKIKTM